MRFIQSGQIAKNYNVPDPKIPVVWSKNVIEKSKEAKLRKNEIFLIILGLSDDWKWLE